MDPLILAIVGGVLVFVLIVAMLLVFGGAPSASERLAESSAGAEATATQTVRTGGRTDPMPQLSDALRGTAFWDGVQMQLLRAGLLLRPSEALIICSVTMMAGLVIGWLLTGQALLAILTAGLGLGAPYMYMVQRASRRQSALTSQLPDALDMLSSALRSGYALTRGFQVVSSQMHPPIADEFQRVLQEVQVGISVSDALEGLLARSDSYDLELVVAAMQTQLTMGGNLSEVLDNIAGMIRERVRLQGEIDAATSEGRLSAAILIAMPIVIALAISAINPGYLDPLFTERLGLMMLGAAGGLMLTGVLIIKKMLDIDI
ncbi:MAG: type II secretion system F family protein [Armatimonadota bacterium]